jgi:hypothetical protein
MARCFCSASKEPPQIPGAPVEFRELRADFGSELHGGWKNPKAKTNQQKVAKIAKENN